MSKPVGRPPMPNSAAKRKKVLKLKASINPKTQRQYTFREIGEIIGTSGANAFRLVKDITGSCRECCRKLQQVKKV